MKTQILTTCFIFTIFFVFNFSGFSQIQIDTNVTAEQMVEKLTGPGILAVDNITFQGVNQARGFFSNADSTNLGMNNGIFLCTGSGANIPGPNSAPNIGTANWIGGHPSLQAISTGITYDASVLEFDFIPINDTLRCKYSFGSEEYNEHVFSEYNDLCAMFLTGPDPMGGMYADKNIGIVPGTYNTSVSINNVNNGYSTPGVVPAGPCSYCWYYSDNTGGLTLEYDGFTTVLLAWTLVIPLEAYHIKIGIADVNGYGYDSGIFLEEQGLYFLGPAELTSYQFLMEHNPGLSFDVTGVIMGNDIYVEVPYGTDITNLVAGYEDKGAYVYVDEVLQSTGVTSNDFTDPVVYHLQGYEIADYTVYVDIVTDIWENIQPEVMVYPNPANEKVCFEFEARSLKFEVKLEITDIFGRMVTRFAEYQNSKSLSKFYWDTKNVPSGIYFYNTNINGYPKSGKIVIQK